MSENQDFMLEEFRKSMRQQQAALDLDEAVSVPSTTNQVADSALINSNMGGSNKEDDLLKELKESIVSMQKRMQDTYQDLSEHSEIGYSADRLVSVRMSATYQLMSFDFGEKALAGGINTFQKRCEEAWKNVVQKIQETTQRRTIELLQGMQIPEDIRNIAMSDKDDE